MKEDQTATYSEYDLLQGYDFHEFLQKMYSKTEPEIALLLTDQGFKEENKKKFGIYVHEREELIASREEGYEEKKKEEVSEFQLYKHNVNVCMLNKNSKEATEHIVTYIVKNNNLYTTRHSTHPEMWIYKEGIYVPHGETYIEEITRMMLDNAYTTYLRNMVVNKIRSDTYIDSQLFFDKQELYPDLVPVENGLLNINSRELEEFSPDKIFFFKLPVQYDSEATCKKIEGFFTDIMSNEEDITVLQEFFGFCLLRNYRYEKSLLLKGNGSNGKSRVIELLKRMLGVENCTSMSIHAITENNFGLSNLHKKLVNMCGDISSKAIQNTSVYKSLTTQEPVTADRKFLEPIQFENYAKMIFSANEMPSTNDLSDGFFRRWIIFDFPYSFKTQEEIDASDDKKNLKLKNPHIINEITDDQELSGLLNWSLIGLQRLKQNNSFSYSNTTEEIKREWLRAADSFYAFCEDFVVEDYNATVIKSDLKRLYGQYCRQHKVTMQSDAKIKYLLSVNYGVADKRAIIDGSQEYIWIGISIKGNFLDDKREDVKEVDMTSIHSKSDVVLFMEKNEHKLGYVDALTLENHFSSEQISNSLRLGEIFEPKPGRYKLL